MPSAVLTRPLMTARPDAMDERDRSRPGSPMSRTGKLAPWMLVFAAALIAMLGAVTDVLLLFVDVPDITGEDWPGWTIAATVLLRTVLSGIALVQSARRRTSTAILALAGLVLVDWLVLLPSVLPHVLDAGAPTVDRFLAFPVAALAAVALARSGRWPWLAALLVGVPTIAPMLTFAAFAVVVMIYGF